MFSPMSSFVFYPAITSLATSLNVTIGLINLAITTYMVVSGITPAILGNAADKIGRRPVYLLALTVYLLANIGLALQNNFAALLVLRMLQSAGSSVGDGSTPAAGINRTLLSLLSKKQDADARPSGERDEVKPRASWPNPLACLKLLFVKDVSIVLLCNGIFYMTYCCMQASLSTLFIDIYGYEELQAGLVYIPFGLGCLASVYLWEAARPGQHDDFPIEVARLRSSFYLVGVTAAATISYGWVVEKQVHVAVTLVLQAITGFSISAVFVALGTLLTDLNPDRPSTAAASANIVRCALAAASLAALQPVIDSVGAGWCFTIFGLLCSLCGPMLLLEMRMGPRWRRARGAAKGVSGG
ncbi:hypothetical protein DL765_010924 [Monosporascus sp. GIB2]|nr:hypothetical protein DL765_010924 [Monosporascus sp. GIB2]